MTKILSREMGIKVCCSGTYCKHDSEWFREQVQGFCDEILITDDHTQVQNFPLGYRSFLGYEGTNQIANLVHNSFSLGIED